MNKKKSGLDNLKTVIIIIQDVKQEYKMELPKEYSGKIIFSFQKGIFQGGKREHRFVAREIDRSLK
ncbi:MAG: hypothetical protein WBB37_07500 [bacterium]